MCACAVALPAALVTKSLSDCQPAYGPSAASAASAAGLWRLRWRVGGSPTSWLDQEICHAPLEGLGNSSHASTCSGDATQERREQEGNAIVSGRTPLGATLLQQVHTAALPPTNTAPS